MVKGDPNDPTSWPPSSATTLCLGLDIGMAQDHSALIAAGAWQSGARSVIGAFSVKQFALGTPLDEVADATAEIARYLKCRTVFDASNNSAFASILAARFGANPANALVAGVITNAADHASQPTPMMLSLMGQRSTIPRWTLSKRELIESVSAEIDSGMLKIGRTGDWEALREELTGMERTVRNRAPSPIPPLPASMTILCSRWLWRCLDCVASALRHGCGGIRETPRRACWRGRDGAAIGKQLLAKTECEIAAAERTGACAQGKSVAWPAQLRRKGAPRNTRNDRESCCGARINSSCRIT